MTDFRGSNSQSEATNRTQTTDCLFADSKESPVPFTVYDYRNPEHLKNLLITPEMRSRILKMEPGQGFNTRHSHDLGHEVFLILQGTAEFEIEGDIQTVETGQLCFAVTDEAHSVRVVGDTPVIMYLSVTPHILPTHTGRTPEGEAKSINFSAATSYDVELDASASPGDRLSRHKSAIDALGSATADLVKNHATALEKLPGSETPEAIREEMWKDVYKVFKSISELGDSWNDLSYSISDG
jgi:quercetin dioxygenase-like cupin family protein